MRKQYTVSQASNAFQRWVTTYHDGVTIRRDKIWVDDYADYADKIEAEGYEKAYKKEEVQKAKEEYERKLVRQLVEVKR